jgi:hypothetical protein
LPDFSRSKHTKTGKNITNDQKTIPNGHQLCIPNGHEIFRMVIKYTNIYHSEALQNLPKFGIFGFKTNHLATLSCAKKIGDSGHEKNYLFYKGQKEQAMFDVPFLDTNIFFNCQKYFNILAALIM